MKLRSVTIPPVYNDWTLLTKKTQILFGDMEISSLILSQCIIYIINELQRNSVH